MKPDFVFLDVGGIILEIDWKHTLEPLGFQHIRPLAADDSGQGSANVWLPDLDPVHNMPLLIGDRQLKAF